MASVCFDLMTTKLLNMKEIFDRLDPKKFGEVMEDALLLMLDTVVNEVAMEYMPSVWMRLPKEVKDELIVVMNIESESFLVGFMDDIKEHIEDVLDIKKMTVSACVREKRLVNKIFLECGDKVSAVMNFEIVVSMLLTNNSFVVSHIAICLGIHIYTKKWVLFWVSVWLNTNGNLLHLRCFLGITSVRLLSWLGNKLARTQSNL